MRRAIFLIPFALMSLLAMGQNPKLDYNDGEFFFAQEDYEEALYAFNKVYRAGYQDNANINYRIGVCLLQIPRRKAEAIPYLEKAVTSISEKYKPATFKEENAPPDALLYLGNAYRINMELEKACEYYAQFEQYQDSKNNINAIFAEQQVQSCSNAVVAMNNPVEYKLASLGQIQETHQNRYNVVFSDDLQTMAFMGKNPFYNGVYVSNKVDGVWTTPLNITPSIASDGNMDVVALSPDGKTMLLAASDEFTSNIYKAEYYNDRWNPAESMGDPINSRYFESHASFSPDGKSIYLSSNRRGTVGAMDLWRSDLQEDGSWSDPVNLGPEINTPLNEEAPFLSPDGKRLYFASQGHNSIGGFDMFYCELQPDGSWGEPINMGYPLNTTDDDMAFSPTGIEEEGATVVFAKGEGSPHELYKFEFIPRDEQPEPAPAEPVEVTAEAEAAAPVAGEAEEAEVAAETEAAEEPAEVEVRAVPAPVAPPPARYMVQPVFFDFDSYALTAEDRSRLDQMADLLKRFSNIDVEITGYTDAIGTYEYNERLSLNRARAVSDYLVSKGIPKERLKTIGMSESNNVARNRTRDNRDAPEGRALNRRVEFSIDVSDNVIIEMEEIQVPDDLKPETGKVTMAVRPVFFDFASDALTEKAKARLDQLVAVFETHPEGALSITGHTDALGSAAFNDQLSLKRAKSVEAYLASKGIPADRMSVSGAGESQQIAMNIAPNGEDAPEGRALNRRVEFSISLPNQVVIESEKIRVPDHLKPELGPITAK